MSAHKDNKECGAPVVYIPANTVVNIGNDKAPEPSVEYEHRKWICNRDAVKKFIGGILGRRDD